jgi:two-component system, LytTR family, response regulator
MKVSEKIKVLIVDDSESAIFTLVELLAYIPMVTIIGKTTDSQKAIELIDTMKPDLAFLDIEMPYKTGLDIVKEQSENDHTRFVFVTAFPEYAVQAVNYNILGYILKPICLDDVNNCIENYLVYRRKNDFNHKVTSIIQRLECGKIKINTRSGFNNIRKDDILYCEADCNYTSIILIDGKKITSSLNLGSIEPMLGNSVFYRVGRSLIINSSYFYGIDRKKKACLLLNKMQDVVALSLPKEKLRVIEDLFG